MKKYHFDALYLLYISIFVEQSMEKESFTIEEEIEITYVSYHALLAAYAYTNSSEDKERAIAFIRSSYPSDIRDVVVDTLNDMLTLRPEMEAFATEYDSFEKLGDVLMKKNLLLLETKSFELKEENMDEFFSYTMYIYESLILLDEYEHNINKLKADIDTLELNEIVVEIINSLH
ncbi:MAG: hypothetical protein ACRCS8_01490 [Brevinema sp.]